MNVVKVTFLVIGTDIMMLVSMKITIFWDIMPYPNSMWLYPRSLWWLMLRTTGVMKQKVKILRDIYGELFVSRHKMKMRYGTKERERVRLRTVQSQEKLELRQTSVVYIWTTTHLTMATFGYRPAQIMALTRLTLFALMLASSAFGSLLLRKFIS